MGLIETLHAEHKQRRLRIQKAAIKLVPQPPKPVAEPDPAPEPAPQKEEVGKLGSVPDIILNEVCKYYDVKRKDVLSRRRFSGLVPAQRMSCYMFHLTTSYTNPKIASIMNRDPSSVGVAIKRAKSIPEDQEAATFLEERIRALIELRQKRERDEVLRLSKKFHGVRTQDEKRDCSAVVTSAVVTSAVVTDGDASKAIGSDGHE